MPAFIDIIKKIERRLPEALASDRFAIHRRITRIKRFGIKSTDDEKIKKQLGRLEKRLHTSIRKKAFRKANRPAPVYNDALPITAKKDEIIASISKNQVIIISGETGSGKTTQIPKFCLAAGRGIDGKIGCTQPRRIAATTVSRRIAEELGEVLGKSVGYKIRFQDTTGKNTYIKMMTDGILLAETQNDPYLNEYDTIIVDEAHERSLNIDFILGILKNLLKKRKDLKLIITSATIDTEKFSKAFANAPVIEVSGRMFPVELRYFQADLELENDSERTHVEMAAQAIDQLQQESIFGDILVFMPTEQDIRETCELIQGRNYQGILILPLFSRLSASDQSRVFSRARDRKIIVATNIAETSITIPGIKYVIDTGLARVSQYNPRSRTSSLPVTAISKSSADQRKGRCGRVENGVCIRLFTEDDFQARSLFTPPEILRANLAEVILRMIALKLGDIENFPFIDRPAQKSIQDGFDLLFELGAIALKSDRKKSIRTKGVCLTEKGVLMAKMPIDPRLSRMLVEAQAEGCQKEIAVIASALSIQDPRERPAEKAREADQIHKTFLDPSSDFTTLLNIWTAYHQTRKKEKTTGRIKRFCKSHFLSFRRMREWQDIYFQISEILREYRLDNKNLETSNNRITPKTLPRTPSTEDSPLYAAIHKSILSGFLSNIALKKEKNIFQGTKGKEVMVFPGSTLFNYAKTWIVAAEMVETTRLFARTCANINNEWLERLGGDLCKYTYLQPHWERNRGEVVASEQVSLFGLIIIPRRPVSYGRINPDEASEIFIQSALVDGDVKKKFPFMLHNQSLIDDARNIENRIRRRDVLVSQAELSRFYGERLEGCYDIKSLERHLKQKGGDRHLRMKVEDILRYSPDDKELSLYPDSIDLGNQSFDCTYSFEPGETDDGVTVKIPSSNVPVVPAEALDWVVPGLYREKITALIKGLPKAYRKQLVPVAHTVDVIINEMDKTKSALITALGNFIYRRFDLDIPASAWPCDVLPDHLKMRISITDASGQELRSSRDPAILGHKFSREPDPDESKEIRSARGRWEKTGITRWDFPDLPEHISIPRKNKGQWLLYPGLEKENQDTERVNLRLFSSRDHAIKSHKVGIATLFEIHLAKDLRFLKKALVLPKNMKKLANYFGGAPQFEKRLFESITHNLFCRNIRSKDAFDSHAERIAPEILSNGRELFDRCLPVLEVYHETRSILFHLETENKTNTSAITFLDSLRDELSRLVPDTFMELYDTERLIHLIRYIKAMGIRAQRAFINFEKDQVKAEEIRFFTNSLDELLQELSSVASEEKKAAIESYFWLIEEYKVSVFAQELKTPVPVSKKRLEKKLKEIQRMS